MWRPSGLKAAAQIGSCEMIPGPAGLPVSASHSRTVLSNGDAETTRLPSGLNATLATPPSCPTRVVNSLPVSASKMAISLSLNAVMIRFPSGLKATLELRRPDDLKG